MATTVDNVVIGGGVYGLHVATELSAEFLGQDTLIVERESDFFARASSKNHGRLHHGYQYPRSSLTADECRGNFDRFKTDFGDCIDPSGIAYYAIHADSLVSSDEYEEFCEHAQLPAEKIDHKNNGDIFGRDIRAVYAVDETVFSISSLRAAIVERFTYSPATALFGVDVLEVVPDRCGVRLVTDEEEIIAGNVFNCGYFGINQLHHNSNLPEIWASNEDCMLFKVKLPNELARTSITAIYGPFGTAVVNAEGQSSHVIAHVEHSKRQNDGTNRYCEAMSDEEIKQRFAKTIEATRSYFPIFENAEYCGNTLETKSQYGLTPVDGERRVVTLEDWGDVAGYHVILGGKMNNFYDASCFASEVVQSRMRKTA